MRLPYLLVWSGLLFSCVPGQAFNPNKSKQGQSDSQPAPALGNDAIPSDSQQPTPPNDPEEEEKAMEPAIIGGAYLYCDAEENTMLVGCRVGNVSELEWVAASKTASVNYISDGSPAECAVTIPVPGSPYHILFSANDKKQMNGVELRVDVALPQGTLSMSTTVNPGSTKAVEQRLGPGLALYATTGAAGDWPGVDRKTWNLWMPLKIPKAIANFGNSDSSGPGPGGPGSKGTAELSFDETVCTYKAKDPKSEYAFVSCTKGWLPDQWVRSKSLSLRVISEGIGPKGSLAAGVVMQTTP